MHLPTLPIIVRLIILAVVLKEAEVKDFKEVEVVITEVVAHKEDVVEEEVVHKGRFVKSVEKLVIWLLLVGSGLIMSTNLLLHPVKQIM